MTYSTINPATGEPVRTFADIFDADLDDALEAAQSCYQNDWRRRPVADRARIVKAAAAELRANAAEHARYVTAEMGKLIGTSQAEVGLSAAILEYYADRAETFLAPRKLPESPGAVIETEPIGVILGHWTCSWTRSASPGTAARGSSSGATGSTVRATTSNRPL